MSPTSCNPAPSPGRGAVCSHRVRGSCSRTYARPLLRQVPLPCARHRSCPGVSEPEFDPGAGDQPVDAGREYVARDNVASCIYAGAHGGVGDPASGPSPQPTANSARSARDRYPATDAAFIGLLLYFTVGCCSFSAPASQHTSCYLVFLEKFRAQCYEMA